MSAFYTQVNFCIIHLVFHTRVFLKSFFMTGLFLLRFLMNISGKVESRDFLLIPS